MSSAPTGESRPPTWGRAPPPIRTHLFQTILCPHAWDWPHLGYIPPPDQDSAPSYAEYKPPCSKPGTRFSANH